MRGYFGSRSSRGPRIVTTRHTFGTLAFSGLKCKLGKNTKLKAIQYQDVRFTAQKQCPRVTASWRRIHSRCQQVSPYSFCVRYQKFRDTHPVTTEFQQFRVVANTKGSGRKPAILSARAGGRPQLGGIFPRQFSVNCRLDVDEVVYLIYARLPRAVVETRQTGRPKI